MLAKLDLCVVQDHQDWDVRNALCLAGVTAIYVAMAWLGSLVAFADGRCSPVWPATGVAIAVLTVAGLRWWPLVAVGALTANVLIVGNPVPVAAGIAIGNTLEAVVGALALRRLGVMGEISCIRDAVALLGVATLAPLPSATFGVLSLSLGGLSEWKEYPWAWLVWWVGDSLGALIFLPLLLAWIGRRLPFPYPARPSELFGTLALAVASSGLFSLSSVFLTPSGLAFLPPAVLLFPAMVWAVLRLRPRASVLVLAVSSMLAIVNTVAVSRSESIGPLLWFEMALYSVGGGYMLLVGALAAVNRDLAERRGLEAELRRLNDGLENRVAERTHELTQANTALEHSNLELQQFAFIAAHDLQTPLRSVMGFAQLLHQAYRGCFDMQADEWLDQILIATRRIHELNGDLLGYLRVRSEGKPFRPVDTGQLFDEVVVTLDAAIRESAAQVTRGDLPIVTGDRTQLAQVLQNLIDNAIKYRRNEPPRVHVSAKRRKGEWVFLVRDNGIGIDRKHWQGIFDIFRRLHTQEAYAGTGIGLAICRRVVHRHGGRIWVRSTLGKGSTFFFTLLDRKP